ncbi:hypothetical protein B0H17DRAFT_1125524 [Mycena rosella]|uniref:Uncharacterized protein n=1 Tax=Mycena rosella TaxID=1033263 RepID=A0AAD7GW76_MYCRO|nr:hypothetical protein B0H17DRAFT_1125524 [Mycena rosella]
MLILTSLPCCKSFSSGSVAVDAPKAKAPRGLPLRDGVAFDVPDSEATTQGEEGAPGSYAEGLTQCTVSDSSGASSSVSSWSRKSKSRKEKARVEEKGQCLGEGQAGCGRDLAWPRGQLAAAWASPGSRYPRTNYTSPAPAAYASPAAWYASPAADYEPPATGYPSTPALHRDTRYTNLGAGYSSPRAASSSHRYRDPCQSRMRIPRRIRWLLRMRGSAGEKARGPLGSFTRRGKLLWCLGMHRRLRVGARLRRGKAIPEAAGMRSIGDQDFARTEVENRKADGGGCQINELLA